MNNQSFAQRKFNQLRLMVNRFTRHSQNPNIIFFTYINLFFENRRNLFRHQNHPYNEYAFFASFQQTMVRNLRRTTFETFIQRVFTNYLYQIRQNHRQFGNQHSQILEIRLRKYLIDRFGAKRDNYLQLYQHWNSNNYMTAVDYPSRLIKFITQHGVQQQLMPFGQNPQRIIYHGGFQFIRHPNVIEFRVGWQNQLLSQQNIVDLIYYVIQRRFNNAKYFLTWQDQDFRKYYYTFNNDQQRPDNDIQNILSDYLRVYNLINIPLIFLNLRLFQVQQNVQRNQFNTQIQQLENYRAWRKNYGFNINSQKIQLILQTDEFKKNNKKYHDEGPCLFKIWRFLTKTGVRWENIHNQWIKKACIDGNIHGMAQFFKQEKIDVGYYLYHEQQWINNQHDQIIFVVDMHAFITNKQILQQFLKSELEIKPPKYHLFQKISTEYKCERYYFDIETFTLQTEQKPYLLCVCGFQNVEFWGIDCCFRFVQWLYKIAKRNKRIEIWSFNGSKFDLMFLIPYLIQYDKNIQIFGSQTFYKQIIFLGNVFFKDFRLIFSQGSLFKLGELFQLQFNKIDFDIAGKSQQFFEQNKQQIIEYCNRDVYVLQQLVEKYLLLCLEFNLHPKNISTVSQLSLSIFQTKYLQTAIQGSPTLEIYEAEKQSYYGGMTICLKHTGKNLNYYDINSSYPFALTKDYPVYYSSSAMYDFTGEIMDYNLYYCEVKFNSELPFLAQHTKYGLIYTKYVPFSWRWGVELNFIKQHNLGTFQIQKYIHYRCESLFKDFINDLYKRRKACKDPIMNTFYKIIINSLYGKFGQKKFNSVKYCLAQYSHEFIQSINMKKFDIVYQKEIEIYKIDLDENNQKLNWIGSLVRLSSYTTALGRIRLMEGILDVGIENVYYMDTDSIFTDKQMSDNLIDQNELGKFKLEQQVEDAYFHSPKMYRINDHVKNKGIKVMSTDDFEQLIENETLELINKNQFKRKFGTVFVIDQKKVIQKSLAKRIWNENESHPYDTLQDFENKIN